jgi:hypothetical protein
MMTTVVKDWLLMKTLMVIVRLADKSWQDTVR